MQSKSLILVVEDEPGILKNLSTILYINGFATITANNGQEAIDILETTTPQLIISDVMMPLVDGFELLKHIKSTPNLINIPFCFLTARADVLDIDNGLQIGANHYITKPFLAKDVIEMVKKLIP
jgi:CheY-like chemotaxis protein